MKAPSTTGSRTERGFGAVPGWLERGEGWFVSTASAAGLLTMIDSPAYSVTKHGAVSFAEWLSVTYRHRGVRVHTICPQGVQTAMLERSGPLAAVLGRDRVLTPEEVADATWEAMAQGRVASLLGGAQAGLSPRVVGVLDTIVREVLGVVDGCGATFCRAHRRDDILRLHRGKDGVVVASNTRRIARHKGLRCIQAIRVHGRHRAMAVLRTRRELMSWQIGRNVEGWDERCSLRRH